MKTFLSFLGLSIAFLGLAQSETSYVYPQLTNPGYLADQDSHMVVRNPTVVSEKLFLFIGGTGSETKNYRRICEFAGDLGFDVIGISYPNEVAAASLKNSTDSLAFDHFRQEICYGTDLSSEVTVDSLNAIHARLTNLLNYLETTHPAENWDQYLTPENELDWSNIIVGGHSQGAGHACYLGKFEPIDRALMFAGPNDYSDHYSRAGNWLTVPGITPVSRQFAYLSLNDEIVAFEKQFTNLKALGLYPTYDTAHVDLLSPPFNNSNFLYTTQAPGLIILNHNVPAVKFGTVNEEVWEHLLTTEFITSTLDLNTQPAFSIYPNPVFTELRVNVENNLLYQTYTLSNSTGQIITTGKVDTSSFLIPVKNLKPGTYFLSIGSSGSRIIIN